MKKRILIVGDPLSQVTGLAYVSGSFARHFCSKKDEYEVAYFTLRGRFEDKIRAVDNSDNLLDDLKIYTMPSSDGKDLMKNFIQTVEDFKPQIVLSVADSWDLEVVAFNNLRYSYCWFAYSTIEVPKIYGDRIFNNSAIFDTNHRSFFKILQSVDLIIPVTQMAKNTLIDFKIRGEKLHNIYDGNVYNGLDIEDKIDGKLSKSEVFGGFFNDDDFLFMTLGVNSERKKVDQVIIAFAEFIKKLKGKGERTDNVKLYLHTNVNSAPSGPDLMAVISEYGMKDNIVAMAVNSVVDKKKIYEIYSCCDIYIGLPGGEGFGYGFAEAMLHKKPVIYIDHGGHAEFAKYGGLPVKVKNYLYAVKLGMKWALPNIDSAVDKMYKLYKDPELRESFGKAGQTFVCGNFGWKKVSSELEEVVMDFYNDNKDENLYGMKFKKLV